MKLKLFLITLVLVSSAASFASARSPERDPFEDPRCQFNYWVGKTLTEIQPALKQTKRPYRTAHFTHSLTEDFRPDRLTIIYNDDEKIKSISCY